MKGLIRLVYRSESCISHDDVPALDAIFRVSVRNNSRDRITGALALPDGKFVQTIEGEPRVVEALLERLRSDSRHTNLAVLGTWPISARLFGGWAMARPDPVPLAEQAFRIMTDVGSGAQVVGLLATMTQNGDQGSFFGVAPVR